MTTMTMMMMMMMMLTMVWCSDEEDYDLELRQIHGSRGLGLGQGGSVHTSHPSLGSLSNAHLHPLGGLGLEGDHGGGAAAGVHYEVNSLPLFPVVTSRYSSHHPLTPMFSLSHTQSTSLCSYTTTHKYSLPPP